MTVGLCIAEIFDNANSLPSYRGTPPPTVFIQLETSTKHTLIRQPAPNNSNCEATQVARWGKIVKQWVEAARTSDCIIIGDINLDLLKWDNPDQMNITMVETTKTEIQSLGFVQMVEGITRSWKGKCD